MCDPQDRQTETEPASAGRGLQAGGTRLPGRHWCSDATSCFPGTQREVERLTLDFRLQGRVGEGQRGPQRGPLPARLAFGSGLPQPLPCDTQELINALQENTGGVL